MRSSCVRVKLFLRRRDDGFFFCAVITLTLSVMLTIALPEVHLICGSMQLKAPEKQLHPYFPPTLRAGLRKCTYFPPVFLILLVYKVMTLVMHGLHLKRKKKKNYIIKTTLIFSFLFSNLKKIKVNFMKIKTK